LCHLLLSGQREPEDLVVGDDVAISAMTYQLGTFVWCDIDSFQFPPDELIQLTFLANDDHQPQKIKSICLPFVLCQKINKKHVVYDFRQLQLKKRDSGKKKSKKKRKRKQKN